MKGGERWQDNLRRQQQRWFQLFGNLDLEELFLVMEGESFSHSLNFAGVF